MFFSEEVSQFFALTELQASQLEAGLMTLEQAFQQAESDVVNTAEFATRFYQKFQQLIEALGFHDDKVEALVDHLCGTER